jgi:hypothetical protein
MYHIETFDDSRYAYFKSTMTQTYEKLYGGI